MKIQFNKLTFNNFLSYTTETVVELNSQGLILIIGPNGVGKSTIHTALTFSLFGLTARGTKIDEVINDEVQKDCYVFLECMVNNKPLNIKRYRQHSIKGNQLEIEYDGNPITGRLPSTQKTLEEEILHMTFEQFTLSTLFSQDKIKYFASETPVNRLKILESLLSLDRFDAAYKIAHEKLTESVKLGIAFETKIHTIETQMPKLQNMAQEIETRNIVWENEKQKEVTKLEQELLTKQTDLLNIGIKEVPIEPNTKELTDMVYKLNRRLAQTSIEKTNAEAEILNKKSVDNLLNTPCPTCTQLITSEVIEQVNNLEEKKVTTLKNLISMYIQDLTMYEQRLTDKKIEITKLTDNYQQAIKDYHKWESQKNMLSFDVLNVTKKIEGAKTIVNPSLGTQIQLEKNIQQMQEDLKQVRSALEVENKIGMILDNTKILFSHKGVRFYYIKQVIHHLELETRRILNLISIGKIDISIVLSQDDVLELNVLINGKARSYSACSHGEKQCVNIGLVFSFNKVMRQRGLPITNILFLDEILDLSMDDKLNEATFKFLDSLVPEISSVFVISHKEQFKSLFSKVWEISGGFIQ